MAVCPICHAEFESALPGRLCETCAAEVIAKEQYAPADLQFVGILAGVLGAAIFSMPGAFIGFYAGQIIDQANRGCLAGLIVMAVVGFATGYVQGRRYCLRTERERRSVAH